MRKNLLRLSLITLCTLLFSTVSWGQYDGVGVFEKITSNSELTDGIYLILNESEEFAMNSSRPGNFYGNTSVNPSSSILTNPSVDLAWEIKINGGGRTIKSVDTNNYPCRTNSTGNNLNQCTSVTSDNQRWTIADDGDGGFTFFNLALTSEEIRYNPSTPRFTCYTTGFGDGLVLYKFDESSLSSPLLASSVGVVSDLNYIEGEGPSDIQSFSVSGENLNGDDVTLTLGDGSGSDFEFETNVESFSYQDATLTLEEYDGADRTIFVRLKGGLPAGSYSEIITISGGGATDITVDLEGLVVPQFEVPYTNDLRTQDDFDLAVVQGFEFSNAVLNTTAGGRIQISADGYVQTPLIDFTEFDGLEITFDVRNGFTGFEHDIAVLVSSDNGDNFDAFQLTNFQTGTGSSDDLTITFNLVLSGNVNTTNGVIRFQKLGGDSALRFRDLSITPWTPPSGVFYYQLGQWFPGNPVGFSELQGDVNVVNSTLDIDGILYADDLNVSNIATLNVNPTGVLVVDGDIINNGDLVFQSDENGSGQLASFTGSITGDITAERFIPKRSDNKRAFRFLASPVNEVSLADSWQENMHITGAGGATNGFDPTTSNNPSMFIYDGEWLAVGNTDVELAHARGYRAFVRGDRDALLDDNDADANADVTLSAIGALVVGSINAPDMASGNQEFSFVGNPYQAVVDLDELIFGDGVEKGFAYYWDPTLADNGAFVIIDIDDNSIDFAPAPGSSDVNRFLQPGQAVFFRNTNDTGTRSIEFIEAAKSTGESQTAIFSEPSIPYVNMRLYEASRFANGGKEQDATGIRFSANGNNEIDSNDAGKMGNSSENFAIINSNQLISIESRAMPLEGEVFGLFTNNYQHSAYVFQINLQNFPEGLTLKLNDTHLNETYTLEEGINEISFSVDANIAASANNQRFNLEVGAVTLGTDDFLQQGIELYPNPVGNELTIRLDASMQASELAIYNLVGKQVMQVSLDASVGNHQINTAQLSSGVYLVKLQTAKGNFTSKLIKK